MNNDKPIHSFDTVIIGSGLGGLATALLLAKSGQSVAVLEKNNQFGGNLQTFSRDKKLIDTGVHYVGGMGEGQNLYRYFSHLDILPDLEWEALDEEGFDRIYFDSHKKYIPQAQGYTRFVDQLVTYFPEHQQEIENYIETVKTYCNAFPMYRLNFEDRYQTEYLEPSVQEVMDALISNPELKAVLLGSNFLYALQYEKTPFYVHALTVNSYIQSAWRCVKGGSQITKALIKQLRKYHVKLFKYQEVQRFETVENTIVACETATDRFVANRFVSNIDLKKTYSFLPKELQKKPSIKRVVALKMTPSVLSVHLTLKEQTIKYFNHNIYHYDSLASVADYNNPIDENFPKQLVITTAPMHKNQKFADTLTLMTYIDFSVFKEWEATVNTVKHPQDRGASYKAFKNQLAQQMIQKARVHFPNLEANIVHSYTSTPLTYRDYIGSENGNLYGFEKIAHQSHITQVFPKTKIANLYLVGQNVRMHGILGVTISAFHLVKELLGTKAFYELIGREETIK